MGTVCILDTEPHPQFSEGERESLTDLAALTVRLLVDRRNQLQKKEDPARLIAHTAHDLMTPLTGLQLSLSLLVEDEDLSQKITPYQTELLATATSCSDFMIRICETAIDSLRKHGDVPAKHTASDRMPEGAQPATRIDELVQALRKIMEPIPKKVPLVVTLDSDVPCSFVADDLKLFRAVLNLVSSACERTALGVVHLRIFARAGSDESRDLVFECEDTGENIHEEEWPYLFQPSLTEESHLRLSLSSVASSVNSLGGKYGFKPRSEACVGSSLVDANGQSLQGSTFWFSVPLSPTEGCLQLCRSERRMATTTPLESPIHLRRKNSGLQGRSVYPQISTASTQCTHPVSPSRLNISFTASTNETSMSRDDCSEDCKVISNDSGITPSSIQNNEHAPNEPIRLGGVVHELSYKADVAMTNAVVDSSNHVSIPLSRSATLNQITAASRPFRKRRALVIDDSQSVRKTIARAFEKLGFEVEQAEDGLEGLRCLKETLFDITLCDFSMPVMDGFDCVKQYRQWESQNRSWFRQLIVGISAHWSVEDSGEGIAAGMDDFRPKPISIKTLTELKNSEVIAKRTSVIDIAEGFTGRELIEESNAPAVIPSAVDSHGLSQERQQETSGGEETNKRHKTSGTVCTDDAKPVALYVTNDTGITVELNRLIGNLRREGWEVPVVNNWKEALQSLQIRNWDLVLMEDDIHNIPAVRCITEFRQWETTNRVNEQTNVFLVCHGDIPGHEDSLSFVQPPYGFNGVIGKPIPWTELQYHIRKRTSHSNILVRNMKV